MLLFLFEKRAAAQKSRERFIHSLRHDPRAWIVDNFGHWIPPFFVDHYHTAQFETTLEHWPRISNDGTIIRSSNMTASSLDIHPDRGTPFAKLWKCCHCFPKKQSEDTNDAEILGRAVGGKHSSELVWSCILCDACYSAWVSLTPSATEPMMTELTHHVPSYTQTTTTTRKRA